MHRQVFGSFDLQPLEQSNSTKEAYTCPIQLSGSEMLVSRASEQQSRPRNFYFEQLASVHDDDKDYKKYVALNRGIVDEEEALHTKSLLHRGQTRPLHNLDRTVLRPLPFQEGV